VVEDGRQLGLRVDLPEGELLLGRTPGEGFAIDDARVSRRHAVVRRTGDYVEVEDLQSRNGIRVNGADVQTRPLQPGDRLEIGDSVLRLEGPAPAVSQIPAAVRVIPSPLRGAFGDLEISHVPARQAQPDALGEADGPDSNLRLKVLARLSALLAARSLVSVETEKGVWRDALTIVAEVVGADHHIVIVVKEGQPVFEAATAHEAQLLSGTLPALDRALPGQLSLSTTVRVNVEDRWAVVLAPVIARDQTRSLLVLIKRIGRFAESTLTILEATAALLGLRGAPPDA
jgi:pSer/pThr/pTyr-binding forkhead associated (FHA) protein